MVRRRRWHYTVCFDVAAGRARALAGITGDRARARHGQGSLFGGCVRRTRSVEAKNARCRNEDEKLGISNSRSSSAMHAQRPLCLLQQSLLRAMSTTAPSAHGGPCAPIAPAWHAAFPAPKANLANGSLAAISCAELRAFQMQQSDALEMRTFLVVDVRRADFEVRLHLLLLSRAWPLTSASPCSAHASGCLHRRCNQPSRPVLLPDSSGASAAPHPVSPLLLRQILVTVDESSAPRISADPPCSVPATTR